MTETNGAGALPGSMPAPPPGAVVLTEEIHEATTKRWVQLPQMSIKVSRMTDEQLLLEGWITSPETWSDVERRRRGLVVVRRRVQTAQAKALPPIDPADEDAAREAAPLPEIDDAAVEADALERPATREELLADRAEEVRRHGAWVQIGMVGFENVERATPPPTADWPTVAQARDTAWDAWQQTATPAERVRYFERVYQGHLELVSTGLETPRLRPDQVRRFGDDLTFLIIVISRLSGMQATWGTGTDAEIAADRA